MADSAEVGRVTSLSGVAFAHDSNGRRRQLKSGDPVLEGEVVVTEAGARVELLFNDGVPLVLRANETIRLDATVFGDSLPDAKDAALSSTVTDLRALLNSLLDGSSLDLLFRETATGQAEARLRSFVSPFRGACLR